MTWENINGKIFGEKYQLSDIRTATADDIKRAEKIIQKNRLHI